MNKYYVVSGELRVLLLAENAEFAALDAIQNHAKGHTLHKLWVFVDERGFRNDSGHIARYFVNLKETMEYLDEELNAED